jgi:hypothetical protein
MMDIEFDDSLNFGRDRGFVEVFEEEAFVMAEATAARLDNKSIELSQPQRMIIYNANVSLEVEEATVTHGQLQQIAMRYNGYVVTSNIWNFDDEFSDGFVSLRVEATYLETVLAQIAELGQVTNQNIYSEDVTMAFIDITGRLQQYRTQEGRLLEIMERADTVYDLITVERELTRLRNQIESLEGQIRFFEQRTALSTITVNFHEPRPRFQSPSFGQSISDGFGRGINALATSTTNLIIGFFSIIPALIVLTIVVLIIVLLVRRPKARRK